jgi:hypothetical protein
LQTLGKFNDYPKALLLDKKQSMIIIGKTVVEDPKEKTCVAIVKYKLKK